MNIKRFTAPTSREALAKARMAFGDGTLILSNRQIAGGVEVMATAEDTLSSLESTAAEPAPAASRQQERAPSASRLQERAADMAANPAQSSRPLRAAQ
ncbi:flagellar biosynthesis protein FlhF, partial [Paracidovorax cattleyae]